jgi:hypothetical protein
MAHEDAATAAVNQLSRDSERLPRPLKRWRLFVAGKGRTSLVMQSPRSETDAARPAGRSSLAGQDWHDSDR